MLDRVEQHLRTISDKYRHAIPLDLEHLLHEVNEHSSDVGDVIGAYERDLAAWFGMNHALAVSSGGAAITVALSTLGVGPGDEVILPPTCPLCTIYPIIQLGATPVFCDTTSDDFGLDLGDLKTLVGARTRAIIDVPMWGYPTGLESLQNFARLRGIPLILDLAHSPGSTLNGRHLATFCDISCFSTHDRKPLATGEGGFILFADADLAQRARAYSRFGNLDGRTFGVNHKLSPIQAALGRRRLRDLDRQIATRRSNAEHVRNGINDEPVNEVAFPIGAQPNYYFMLLELPIRIAARFIDHLDNRGIPSDIKRYGCKPLYEFPACAPFYRPCLNAERRLKTVTTIPVHPGIEGTELDYVIDVIKSFRL